MRALRWMAAVLLMLILAAPPALAQTQRKPPDKPRDSLWNGMLIGAAAGVAGTLIFTKKSCGSLNGDSECTAIAGPVGGLIMIPAGIVIGALIDRSIGNQNVMIGPAVGKHKAGVVGTIRF